MTPVTKELSVLRNMVLNWIKSRNMQEWLNVTHQLFTYKINYLLRQKVEMLIMTSIKAIHYLASATEEFLNAASASTRSERTQLQAFCCIFRSIRLYSELLKCDECQVVFSSNRSAAPVCTPQPTPLPQLSATEFHRTPTRWSTCRTAGSILLNTEKIDCQQ